MHFSVFFRRRIFSPTFSSPFAEPEPEPEPSSRARFGGSFSRRFFDARVRSPVVAARPTVAPAITASEEEKPAEPLEVSEPSVIQPRSLAQPRPDFPVNNIIFSDSPPPPGPPPPPPPPAAAPSNIWNVDRELFQIVPAVPGREVASLTEEVDPQPQPQFVALLAVPDQVETERSRGGSSEGLGEEIGDISDNQEYLEIINCDFDCVTKLCQPDDEQCVDQCYQFCSRNPQ